jgi:hypothetical protein
MISRITQHALLSAFLFLVLPATAAYPLSQNNHLASSPKRPKPEVAEFRFQGLGLTPLSIRNPHGFEEL